MLSFNQYFYEELQQEGVIKDTILAAILTASLSPLTLPVVKKGLN